MRSIGIVRKVDDLGRIVIPKELRRSLNIVEGEPLEILADEKGLYLRKYVAGCHVLQRLRGPSRVWWHASLQAVCKGYFSLKAVKCDVEHKK